MVAAGRLLWNNYTGPCAELGRCGKYETRFKPLRCIVYIHNICVPRIIFVYLPTRIPWRPNKTRALQTAASMRVSHRIRTGTIINIIYNMYYIFFRMYIPCASQSIKHKRSDRVGSGPTGNVGYRRSRSNNVIYIVFVCSKTTCLYLGNIHRTRASQPLSEIDPSHSEQPSENPNVCSTCTLYYRRRRPDERVLYTTTHLPTTAPPPNLIPKTICSGLFMCIFARPPELDWVYETRS